MLAVIVALSACVLFGWGLGLGYHLGRQEGLEDAYRAVDEYQERMGR